LIGSSYQKSNHCRTDTFPVFYPIAVKNAVKAVSQTAHMRVKCKLKYQYLRYDGNYKEQEIGLKQRLRESTYNWVKRDITTVVK